MASPEKHTVTSREIVEEGLQIVEKADRADLTMRMLGAAAFYLHCRENSSLYQALGRELSDLDFAAYSRQSDEIVKLLEGAGFWLNKELATFHPGRHIFGKRISNLRIDVFYDKLEMCHVIDFNDRLKIDRPTIPLAEMLLEKMQIVKITNKDVIDTIVLLRTHEVGNTDNDTINSDYISNVLSNDWGFFYTVTTNLTKIRDTFLADVPSLSDQDKNLVRLRIDAILARIDERPKSARWKIRARLGTRKIWYNEVEDIKR